MVEHNEKMCFWVVIEDVLACDNSTDGAAEVAFDELLGACSAHLLGILALAMWFISIDSEVHHADVAFV